MATETKSNAVETLHLGGGDDEPAIDVAGFMGNEDGPQQKVTKGQVNKALRDVEKLRSREEIAESQTLIMKITRYLTSPRLEKYLNANGFKQGGLKSMSNQELQEMLLRIQTCVA